MDALVEFLFKYRPIVFENGHLGFGMSWFMSVVVLVLGAAALAAIITYVQVRMRGTPGDRRKLIAMRTLLLVILAFVLLRPVLVVSSAFGRQNVVGVVVDDSRSMQVADMSGQTRADVVRSLFGNPDSSLYHALNEKFVVRFFRVNGEGGRAGAFEEIAFDGPETRLAAALEGTRQDLSGLPLAGLVLVSDGADNAPGQLTETLLALKSRKVPVHTLGIGRERFEKDIEINRVEAPHTVLKGASVLMDISVLQRGFGGETAQIVVEDSGRVVAMKEVTLPKDGEAMSVRLIVPAAAVGARVFTVRAAARDNELVRENNARTAMVMVRDRRDKILYVEGAPRAELKFLRQALDEDENLQLVTLMRTGKDRYMRFGVSDSFDLVDGFPTSRDALFSYRAIVLGNIEASFFTIEQMRMIVDFVNERGGGFLMLGGRQSFAEGGYANTPIADLLPVELPTTGVGEPMFREVKVNLTPAGAIEPVTQIAGDEIASAKKWERMPAVSSVNRVLGAKPGAGTYLVGSSPKSGDKESVILAYHRYGLGKSMAFMVQDSWLWRMHADVPLEDETYRSFWRQVLRSLVNEVPGRVTLAIGDQGRPNKAVHVTSTVYDKDYQALNGANVSATVVAPSGSIVEIPFEWSGLRDGEYRALFTSGESGIHTVRVTARTEADTVLSDQSFVNIGIPTTEFFGAELRAPLLRRIAEETGGRYYTSASALGIAKDLVYSQSGNVAPEHLDLWDMPIVFILLLGLLVAEWSFRRGRGLI